ncbi:MAG: hypothetical protein ACX931_12480 [Saccharospirillum sp.]
MSIKAVDDKLPDAILQQLPAPLQSRFVSWVRTSDLSECAAMAEALEAAIERWRADQQQMPLAAAEFERLLALVDRRWTPDLAWFSRGQGAIDAVSSHD